MPTFVIYNPACGDRTAPDFFAEHVLPLIEKSSAVVDHILVTEHAGHAADFLKPYLAADEPITIILGSGDGTLHEIVDGPPPKTDVRIALVPCGTANALYASFFSSAPDADATEHKLRSLRALLTSLEPQTRALTLARTTLDALPGKPEHVTSAVVTSTSLHASILHDSEVLRASMPGIERFKVAASQNIARWYAAIARLLPIAGSGRVEIYDPAQNAFVPHPESAAGKPLVLAGPFAYFVSTVNVDRLEPQFRIAPLHTDIAPAGPAVDIVVVRPARDPTLTRRDEEARNAFSTKLIAVLQGAYQDGAHVRVRYGKDGSAVSEGDGPTVVEYFRAGGWEWQPDENDERASLVCADGDIHEIAKGGKATCIAQVTQDGSGNFSIFV